jgi:hypothetical protein
MADILCNLTWVRYSSRDVADKTSADRAAQRERQWHTIALAIFAPLWFGGIILYALVPGWIRFFAMPLPTWFRLIMAALMTFCMLKTSHGPTREPKKGRNEGELKDSKVRNLPDGILAVGFSVFKAI